MAHEIVNLNNAIQHVQEARKECCELYQNTDNLELCRDLLKAIKTLDAAARKLNESSLEFRRCE